MKFCINLQQRFGLFNENELKKPLFYSDDGNIQGWEAWQAVGNAITKPSPETLAHLQKQYITAKNQFENDLLSKKEAS